MTRAEPITVSSTLRLRSPACRSGLRLVVATLLAWGAAEYAIPALTLGESFLTATEEQTDSPPSPFSTAWFRPFLWQNTEPKVEETRQLESFAAPQRSSPLRKGLSALNPFHGRYEAGTRRASQAPTFRTGKNFRPPDDMLPVFATDGPVQPGSVQRASSAKTPDQRQPIEWPADELTTPTPVRRNAPSQGINPLAWSNSAPPADHSFGPSSNPLAVQALGRVASKVTEPVHWSNDPRGQEKPQELMPPEEQTFGAAFQESLSFVQPGQSSTLEPAEKSFPPADATEAEVIAWEKENLPWIRPFYWANEDQYEIAFESEDISQGSPASGKYLRLLGSPFTWTDERPPNRQRPPAKPVIAPDVSKDTRRVAYLQGGEELPKPLPALAPNDGEAQSEILAEGDENLFDEEEKGALAEAEKIGEEPPEDNSLQFLRADTVLLKPGEFQFDYGFNYTKFDTDFPLLISAGMGLVTVADAEFRIREFEVPLEVRYGLARRVQLFLNVPFGWANTELTLPGYEEFENDGGIGDVSFGGTFLLREHCADKPDAILTLAATAPTGNDPFSPGGLSPSAPSLGGGSWSLASNLLFIQNYDPVVVFYGFGTRQYFLTDIAGVNFRPGGEYNYQMGVGFAVNSNITFSTRFNGAYVTEARLAGERIIGTIQEPMTLTLAMTVAKCKKLVEPFIDFGLTDDAVDARFGITWTR